MNSILIFKQYLNFSAKQYVVDLFRPDIAEKRYFREIRYIGH